MLSTRIAALLRNNTWALNLIFIASGSYFVAGATNTLMARLIRVVPSVDDVPPPPMPVARMPTARGNFSVMAERNLLALKREQLSPAGEVVQPAGPQPVSGRNFKESELQACSISGTLRATIVADVPEWSMAVVLNNATHEPTVFTINDGSNQIAEDATLVLVRSREIIVRRRDHFERCLGEGEGGTAPPPPLPPPVFGGDEPPSSPEVTGVTKVSENDYRVERAEVDRALANLNEVATQARVVPSFKNGKPNGFKMFSIKSQSIYQKIGLQNGDVIQRINGYEMNSPDRALEVFAKLREATSLTIEIQRRGESRTLNYAIVGR